MAMYSRRVRQLAKSMQNRTDALPLLGVTFGTVKTVTAGGASDGNAAVVVTVFRGTDQAMGYLAAYTPVVGHTVVVLSVARYPVILGRVVGLPSY